MINQDYQALALGVGGVIGIVTVIAGFAAGKKPSATAICIGTMVTIGAAVGLFRIAGFGPRDYRVLSVGAVGFGGIGLAALGTWYWEKVRYPPIVAGIVIAMASITYIFGHI